MPQVYHWACETRVCAVLHDTNTLGYAKPSDNDGVSEDACDDSGSDVSDVDDNPHPKATKNIEVDSDDVD
ncbi:hypothetical protein L916_09054 [Phytophthora nicotianae]|uniref:Uncharacterized protein n=1 Tax=Phytophthora nicotianae TaxID=4792 RepID=W2IZP0_PHYNI|nr:hypothetical protein L916_09054 [Phytophthora nicotianae]